MTNKEEELAKHYPEAPLLVELAKTVWNSGLKAARVDFSLSDRLKVELRNLLDKDIESIFITDSKVLFVKKVNGTVYTASVERGNKQIGVITFWKTKARSGA